jgi:pyridoxal phosphate enzyme (YggS family)
MTDLEHNLKTIQQRIIDAAQRAGRDPNDITLVAVSKTHPAQSVMDAYALGVRHFGENRIEEAGEKIPITNYQLPSYQTTQPPNHPTIQPSNITWHLIGHLQSRKVRDAVALFDIIHSVDTVSLAKHISDRAGAIGKTMAILLEVNVSGEESKDGFAPHPREKFFDDVRAILAMPNLDVQGLMTIAPIVPNPDDARPHFRALYALRDELAQQFPGCAWQHLSMGMTDDFEAAIAEGATMVRIGRAIFGERK